MSHSLPIRTSVNKITRTNDLRRPIQSMPGQNSNQGLNIKTQRQQLPVYEVRESLIAEIKTNDTLIIIGETGCGKSTQIPQYVFEERLSDNKVIAITQPRRLAATSLARRVSTEMNCDLGGTVGYCVRFEEVNSDKTKIKYLTDGMLLREALSDRTLRKYSVIFLDEAHERNINTDVLFGILKEAQRRRKFNPLKLIVMSATMDVDHFSNYFDKAPVIYLEGRQYDISVHHTKRPQEDRIFSALCTVRQINDEQLKRGDILVFLSGSEEIEAMVHSIKEMSKMLDSRSRTLKAFPLYAALPNKYLDEIFNPVARNERKVIVATNVAETSITIPGVKYVIDSGLVKVKTFDPTTGLELLRVENISQAQAWQRTGRAGRESDGLCYRTYTKEEFDKLQEFPVPEIMRCNLANTVLTLLGMGVDAYTFDFMSRPSNELMEAAVEQLALLGAIESKTNRVLTELGKKMTGFPLDPALAKVILCADDFNCLEEVLSIVAVLSAESVFYRPSPQAENRNRINEIHEKFLSSEGDHITLLNVYRQYNSSAKKKAFCHENHLISRNLKFASKVRSQLVERCKAADIPMSSCGKETYILRKCLISGLFTNIAELQRDKKYRTLHHGRTVSIHPSSALRHLSPSYILYSEIIRTNMEYVRTVSMVDPDWFQEVAPDYFRSHRIGHVAA